MVQERHSRQHRRVVPRARHLYRAVHEDLVRWARELGAVVCLPSRSSRRGHDVGRVEFFMPEEDWGDPVAELAATARFVGYLRTLAACQARPLASWPVPADDPMPAQPLERLTSRQPRAPSGFALGEARAA